MIEDKPHKRRAGGVTPYGARGVGGADLRRAEGAGVPRETRRFRGVAGASRPTTHHYSVYLPL